MKTPMQEMLEWVNDYPTEVPTIHKSAVIAKAKQLLKEEREADKNNYIAGYLDNGYYEGAEEDAAKLWEKTYGFNYK